MLRMLAALAFSAILFGAACDMPAGPAAPGSTATRFPIVLAEGLFGFDFFQIPADLRVGGAQVFTTRVNPFGTNADRGAELITQIEAILAETGAEKVNLFGHSQGGLDARFILATRPELLASLTQFGSPNTGSAVADALLPLDDGTLAFVIGLIGIVGGEPGTPAEFRIALDQLSTPGMAAFNAQLPDGLPDQPCGVGAPSVNGVPVFSFAGNTPSTNPGDLSDFVFGLTALNFVGAANDGLVAVCSAHFGTVLRDDLAMNHLDLVNQLNGAVGTESPLTLYRNMAAALVQMGL
jgi:triacylglycerol lipase